MTGPNNRMKAFLLSVAHTRRPLAMTVAARGSSFKSASSISKSLVHHTFLRNLIHYLQSNHPFYQPLLLVEYHQAKTCKKWLHRFQLNKSYRQHHLRESLPLYH
jgi:hypothetical protein